MEVNDPIEAAQDDTAPAGGEEQQAGSAVNSGSVLDDAATAEQNAGGDDTTQPKPEKTAVNSGSILDEDAGEEGGEEKEKEGAEAAGEEYALEFPEGVVADPEAVKVLNDVGKEFGVSGEKAQQLATAATEYAMRQVRQTIDGAEQRFIAMRKADRAALKQGWGTHYDAYRTEAGLGLARMEKEGRIPPDVRGGDLQFLLEKQWFLDMLREEHRRNTEQAGTMGERGGASGTAGDGLDELYPGLPKK